MKNKMSLREQLQCIANGESIDHCHNFYDWFCRDSALPSKAKLLWSKVRKFLKIVSIDVDVTYVFFKNNCPMCGSLYDDFRICDAKTGNVIFTIVPKNGRNGKAELWGAINDFDGPFVEADDWKQLLQRLAPMSAMLAEDAKKQIANWQKELMMHA
jgi:hypothetical protein